MSTGPLNMPVAAPVAGGASLFANRDFVRLWLGQAASQLGDRIHHVAVMWYTLDTTGSLALTGLILIATTLPAVLLGPVAGTLADRFDRKRIMVGTDIARGLLVLALTALALMGQLSFPVLVVASALLAILTALFLPANMAMVPALVKKDELLRASSLMEMTVQGAGLAGPAIGGLVVAAVGASAAFGVNGLSFLLSGLLLLGLRFPAVAAGAAATPFLKSMGEGFGLLRRMPTIGGLLGCFAVLNFFSVSVLLFLPYFAKEVFKAGPTGLGILEATVAGGMLLAALSWGRIGKVSRRFPVIFASVAGSCATFIAMGLAPGFWLFAGALGLTGALFGSMNVVVMAFFQERVPPEEMGRFMGLLTSVVFALMPVSYGVFGLLAASVSPQTLLMVNGGAIGLVALLLFAVPGLRKA